MHRISSLHRALDIVAREHRYLALLQAPPLEQSVAFYQGLIDGGFPHFVALGDDARVIGWCDVSPVFGQSRAHIGVLGIALLPQARGRGWARGCCRRRSTGHGPAG